MRLKQLINLSLTICNTAVENSEGLTSEAGTNPQVYYLTQTDLAMNEEVLVYGKNNLGVVPHLELWDWPIAVYLVLGGVAAGVLYFSSNFFLTGKGKDYPTAVKWTVYCVPPALVVGLLALFTDLKTSCLSGGCTPV